MTRHVTVLGLGGGLDLRLGLREGDAEQPQGIEGDGDAIVILASDLVELHAKAVHSCAVEVGSRAGEDQVEQAVRGGEISDQVLAFREKEMELERLGVEARPGVWRREGSGLRQVIACGGIGDGGLCLLAGEDVQAKERLPLLGVGDQIHGAVQLVDDREHVLGGRIGRQPGEKQTADAEVRLRLLSLRDERIGRLLDAIVDEPVRPIDAHDESSPHGFPERRVQLVDR